MCIELFVKKWCLPGGARTHDLARAKKKFCHYSYYGSINENLEIWYYKLTNMYFLRIPYRSILM